MSTFTDNFFTRNCLQDVSILQAKTRLLQEASDARRKHLGGISRVSHSRKPLPGCELRKI